jgi:hypothetical protein
MLCAASEGRQTCVCASVSGIAAAIDGRKRWVTVTVGGIFCSLTHLRRVERGNGPGAWRVESARHAETRRHAPSSMMCARGDLARYSGGRDTSKGSALGCPLIGWAEAAARCASERSALCDQTSRSAHISCSLATTARLASRSFCSAAPPRLQPQLQLPPAPAHTSCTDMVAQNRATPRRTSTSSCLRRF